MKNKILISLIFLICIFLIPSFCAASFDFNFDGKDYSLPDFLHFDDFFIVKYDFGIDIISFESFVDCYVKKSSSSDGYDFLYKTSAFYWSRLYNGNSSYNILHNGEIKKGGILSTGGGTFIYSTFDMRTEEGDIIFDSSTKIKFNLTVEPTEKTTNVPVVIHTDYYSLEDFSDILVQYSYDNKVYETCKWRRLTDSESVYDGMYQFYLEVYSNDTYYFKFSSLRDDTEEYSTVVVRNIIYTQDNPRRLY